MFVSVSGLDTDDGKIVAVLALTSIALLVLHATQTDLETRPAWPPLIVTLMGVGIAGIGFYDRSDIESRISSSGIGEYATVGWGGWLVSIAGAVLAVSSFVTLSRRDEPYGKRSTVQSGQLVVPTVTQPVAPPQPRAPEPAPTMHPSEPVTSRTSALRPPSTGQIQ